MFDNRYCIAVALLNLVVAEPLPQGFKAYPTKYYTIHTDLDDNAVQEATLRLNKMAEDYQARTSAFTGVITTRLPFWLFRNIEEYYAAGGLPRSSGVYTGDRLMAVAGENLSPATWKIIQHEGWHQFVHNVIGGDIPVWVNEGLAVYFEEAVFTGDGFVAGIIPQSRLGRIRRQINDDSFKSLPQMMRLARLSWNHEMTRANYDQAWSMVHFLAHADNGRYRSHFDGFLQDVSRKGLTWQHAWKRNFDATAQAFEKAWRTYWQHRPDNPTVHLYAEAIVATMTSYLARAYSQGQTFKTAQDFFKEAGAGKLNAHPQDWLPPALLKNTLNKLELTGQWSLNRRGSRPPKLVCTLEDGKKFVGTFTVARGRVLKVSVAGTARNKEN